MKTGGSVHHKLNKRAFSQTYIVALFVLLFFFSPKTDGQNAIPTGDIPPKYIPDTRIDNMGYWRRLAEAGLVTVQPTKPAPFSIKHTSKLSTPGIVTYDSPDIPVTETNSLQSENSIFVDPENGANLLNSNNSHLAPYNGTQYGADALQSADGGSTWDGTVQGAGGYNFGDPATAISRSGRMYVGFIFSGGGQGISYSDDQGLTWHKRGVASAPGGFGNLLDKNHLWIDNSLSSPYQGNLYDGWTVISGGSSGSGQLQVSRSMDGGLAWQMPAIISNAVAAGSHNQGINIHTGPLGEVYATWAIYDSWPADEKAIGFARSLNGGQNWEPSSRILNNIKGIRTRGVNKLMRVNSFPSMAVDNSFGPDRGSIYVVWANSGEPGINEGSGIDIYMIKSTDKGDSWSIPLKINQDDAGQGKQHYFPWITCDPENGNLAVVFYDDRNVPDNMCETWVAVSKNGGISWQDFRVSDVAYTPEPLTGASDMYFGDYLGITSKGGMVYPCWTDNRTGDAMAYISPFRLGPLPGKPFIEYYTHRINDTLSGNSNGKAEYGETFSLSITMRNIGDQPDSAVSVKLSCDSPYIQILDSSLYFGDFAPGELKNFSDAFLIRLSDSVPDNYENVFTLTATDIHDSSYLSSLVVRSNAPHLTLGPLTINDFTGNNNNQLDPGESVIMSSILSNNGNYVVASATSTLSTDQWFCHISNPTVYSSEIAPGENDTIFWQVDIDAGIASGTSAGFLDSLKYAGQQFQKLYLKKIGVLTEDWESGDLSKMAWVTGGDKPWSCNNFMVYEGLYSLRSGYIKSLDSSRFSITLNLVADDSISFYRKVSSELSFDFLSFYIDDLKVGQWSGEKDWNRISYPVPSGRHTIRWEYTKDLGTSSGYDAAWIDFIEFPVQQSTVADAGEDASICEGNTFQPSAVATNYQSLNWSSTGNGIFNDTSIFNPVYIPSPSDIEAGSVQLILTLKGFSFGEIVKDTLLLSIAPKPTADVGPDTYTCTGDVFILSATATDYLSVKWHTTGDGIFENPDTLITTYIPGVNEIHNGLARLILQVVPESTCTQQSDTLLLNIYEGFSAMLTGDTAICKGDTAFLKLRFTGQGPWRVFLSDGTSLNFIKPIVILPVAPLETTIYTIDSISNLAGCSYRNTLTTTVTVMQPPVTKLSGPAEICSGKQVIFQADADSAAAYYWLPGEYSTPFITSNINGAIGEIQKIRVQVTGQNGCITSDSICIKIVAECDEKQAGNIMLRYHPNPTNGNFSLTLSSATDETADVYITSMDNKTVYSSANIHVYGINTINIDLNKQSTGTYVLSVRNGKNEFKDKLILFR